MMHQSMLLRPWAKLICVVLVLGGSGVWSWESLASGLTVRSDHPRLLLTPTIKAQLLAKKNANDSSWLVLKARADELVTYSIFPYKYDHRQVEPDNTIFYDYQGSGWYDAAMPLALTFQMTGDIRYSNKLLELADEMIRAQSDPDNNPPNGRPPLQPDLYYPTRYLGSVIAIIYDWCYDQLGATRKAQMVSLMNTYFDDTRANAYQTNDHADGNYFGGHLGAAGFMGYASNGDNSRAQEMIDYARIRFDGTPGNLVDPSNVPENHFDQVFEGGYKPEIARGWNGPNINGAPFKGSFDFQGWAYGTANYNRIIDYMLVVKSTTGEDLILAHTSWFSQIFRAEKHALLPNHFEIDPTGDWGGDYGCAIMHSLPIRLAYVLAGTADGPGVQHFAYSEIATHSPYSEFYDSVYQRYFRPAEWEEFYFTDTTRPSAELALPPYYSGFGPVYAQAGETNGAIPYFIMRSDWGTHATWASLHMGAAWYDDHQHKDAGTFTIKHGNDYLLIDASNWKGAAASIGIVGSSTEAGQSAAANTLWLNDFGDFQHEGANYSGGQGIWGRDEVIAAEQNDIYTYVRSDLSTAYNRGSDPSDQIGRPIDFYRSFLYLRSANLFITYDQVKAQNFTNSYGQYPKHMRWHFPNHPTINGKSVQVDQGASRLYLETLLPASASITAVDESNNPDPCDGSVAGCIPYASEVNNSGTWRIEVKDPNNPLFVPFLTVIQVGDTATASMVTFTLTSIDSKMIGARITQAGGETNAVLFNSQPGQVPAPASSTSYNFSGPTSATHTLMGMIPNATYRLDASGSLITVTQDSAGILTASPAGVLQFTVLTPGGPGFLSVTPADGFSSSGNSGGPFSPSGKAYTLQNTGGSSIDWTASKTQTWVTLSSSGGTLASGDSTTVTVTINSSANILSPGSYTDTVTFTHTANGNGNTPRSVSLTVNTPGPVKINLSSPSDGERLDACSYYTPVGPPTFVWDDNGNTFKSIEVQFSTESSFPVKLVKVKGSPSGSTLSINSSTWKKILLLHGPIGGRVYWKVVGIKSDKSKVESDPFSFIVEGPMAVGNPQLSHTSRTETPPPTLSWENECNLTFKVWFGSDSLFTKKKSFSFKVTNPNDNAGVFTGGLTPQRWTAVRKLVGDVSGSKIYWYVDSWDGLNRNSKTEPMIFILTN